MSSLRLQLLGLVAAGVLVGCASPQRPQLKVIGVEQSDRHSQIKLFVEVTNYAKRPMHLERLEYQFGPSGSRVDQATGAIALSRTVEADSAVVVEVPILVDPDLLNADDLELRGQLITEQDQIFRSYPVSSPVADTTNAGE